MQPEERLGANRNHSQIQSHRFFRDISWQNLHKQTPPEIKQYFLVSFSCIQEVVKIGSISVQGQNSSMPLLRNDFSKIFEDVFTMTLFTEMIPSDSVEVNLKRI